MGRRGPPPTPAAVLKLRGTWRRDRHQELDEEAPLTRLAKLPRPPSFLDEVGAFEWRRVGPELVERGLLANADLAAFTMYCVNVSRGVACEKVIKAKGMTFLTPSGLERARPEVSIARLAMAEARRFCQEFGLTPSARRRVDPAKIPTKKAVDDWDDIASG